jgi:hypothetical protein
MRDEPQDPESGEAGEVAPPPAFEAPHSNGVVHKPEQPAGRKHAPWEFLILSLFVALLCIGIILGWTLVGSHSPERLDAPAATAIAAACTAAQSDLKALPNPDPTLGADRVARVRAENNVLRTMIQQFATVQPSASAPATAVRGWSTDWTHMIDARATYADALENAAGTDKKVRLIYPAVNAIKPVTNQMDDFVRENNPHLDPCFTEALQLEVVEGPREYLQVTK